MALFQKIFGKSTPPAPTPAAVPAPAAKPQAPRATSTPFGIWLGITGSSQGEIAKVFQLSNARPCTWDAGVRECVCGATTLFITEPIGRVNLVIGNALPDMAYRRSSMNWLAEKSASFEQLTAYMVQPRVAVYAFAYAEQGALYRIYAVGQGSIKVSLGDSTDAEDNLGYILPETDEELYDGIGFTTPDEKVICSLASQWGADPQQAFGTAGIVGTVPRA